MYKVTLRAWQVFFKFIFPSLLIRIKCSIKVQKLTQINNIHPTCWIITEGIAGTENQCLGVAQALGISATVKRITLNEPWKSLSPYLGFERAHSFTPALTAPWPDLLITSGRKAIAPSRFIKKQSKGKTVTVHIQDPRINPQHFDLLAVPAHDPARGKNVIVTKASPNKITHDLISSAKGLFPGLGNLPSPRIAVLIGGSSQAYTMTREITQNLADALNKIDAPLMITCSRRTGDDNRAILEHALNTSKNYFWNGQDENPYLAMLGWADMIMVTADSASMISESCTTGKPVYMIDLEGGSKRITALHNSLIKHGALRRFEGALEPYHYEPLNDSKLVADEIKNRFGALLSLHDA